MRVSKKELENLKKFIDDGYWSWDSNSRGDFKSVLLDLIMDYEDYKRKYESFYKLVLSNKG